VRLEFSGEIWFWKGPAPWHFVTVPDAHCAEIEPIAAQVTYGWGMIPATVTIGESSWETALWPKDGAYIVPIKTWVRKAEDLQLGDTINLSMEIAT
jgi:hypothetical protein